MAMASAFAASMRGVRRLEGSLIRSRAKFCDSAITRPCIDGFLQILREPIKSSQHDGLDLLIFFLFGVVFVRFEIRDDQSFDHGLRGGRARAPLRAREIRISSRRASSSNAARSRQSCADRRWQIFRLPRTDNQQALRVQAFGKMDQHGLQRLAGDFPAGDQRGEAAVHGGIDVGEHAIDFFVLIENVSDECVGVN